MKDIQIMHTSCDISGQMNGIENGCCAQFVRDSGKKIDKCSAKIVSVLVNNEAGTYVAVRKLVSASTYSARMLYL